MSQNPPSTAKALSAVEQARIPAWIRSANGGYEMSFKLGPADGCFDDYDRQDEAFLEGRVSRHAYEFDPQVRKLLKEVVIRNTIDQLGGLNVPNEDAPPQQPTTTTTTASSSSSHKHTLVGGEASSNKTTTTTTAIVESKFALNGSNSNIHNSHNTSSNGAGSDFDSDSSVVMASGTGGSTSDMGISTVANGDEEAIQPRDVNLSRYCRNGQLSAIKKLFTKKLQENGGNEAEAIAFFTRYTLPYNPPLNVISSNFTSTLLDTRGAGVNKAETFYFNHISETATPLMWAALGGHLSIVRYFTEMGVSIHTATETSRRTALHWAVMENHLDVVRFLIENGADPRLLDSDGFDCYVHAIHNDNLVMLMFLHYICPINPLYHDLQGHTYAHWAAFKNNLPALEFVHRVGGVELDVIDSQDRTALHWAASEGATDCVHCLIGAGAPVRVIDVDRKMAAEYAAERFHKTALVALKGRPNGAPLSFVKGSGEMLAQNNMARMQFFTAMAAIAVFAVSSLYLPNFIVVLVFILGVLLRRFIFQRFVIKRPVKTGIPHLTWPAVYALSESVLGLMRGNWCIRRRDFMIPTFAVGIAFLEFLGFVVPSFYEKAFSLSRGELSPSSSSSSDSDSSAYSSPVPQLFIPFVVVLALLALLAKRNAFVPIVGGKSIEDSDVIPLIKAAAAKVNTARLFNKNNGNNNNGSDNGPVVIFSSPIVVPLPASMGGGSIPLQSITNRTFDLDRHVRLPPHGRAAYCVEIDRFIRGYEGWSMFLDAPVSAINHHWFVLFTAITAIFQLYVFIEGRSRFVAHCSTPAMERYQEANAYWLLESDGFIAGYVPPTVFAPFATVMTWILNNCVTNLMPCRDRPVGVGAGVGFGILASKDYSYGAYSASFAAATTTVAPIGSDSTSALTAATAAAEPTSFADKVFNFYGAYRPSLPNSAAACLAVFPLILFSMAAVTTIFHLYRVSRAVTGPEIEYPFLLSTGSGGGGGGGGDNTNSGVAMSTVGVGAASSSAAAVVNVGSPSSSSGLSSAGFPIPGGNRIRTIYKPNTMVPYKNSLKKKVLYLFQTEELSTRQVDHIVFGGETIYGSGSTTMNILRFFQRCFSLRNGGTAVGFGNVNGGNRNGDDASTNTAATAASMVIDSAAGASYGYDDGDSATVNSKLV